VDNLKQDLAALRIEREPERSRWGRWLAWVVILLAIGGLGAGARVWLTRERPVQVQVATVTERAAGTQAAVLNASGYVTARRRATVSSKITGKVVEVNIEEGKNVTEGEVLARLDDSNVRAALMLTESQAEAARRAVAENEVRLGEARTTLGRRLQLLKERVTAQSEVDESQASVDSYEARLNASRQQVSVAERQIDVQKTELDSTIIRAPFSGVVISKDAQPGEMVSPVSAGGGFTRTGIGTIVDMRSLEIDVDVNEAYINRVTPGQDVAAVLNAYPDWTIPARVITTVPTADRQKATVLVRIGFKALDPRILPDMGVKVTFLRDEREGGTPEGQSRARGQPAALVPKAAVRTEDDQTVVFVVNGNLVERRAVTIGGADGDRLEAVAGLRSGERVVAPVPANLKDGMHVNVETR
jgi:RND family efflux transporter MFP subunit